MAKDPAFLFYAQDFNDGTQDFTNEEVGAYLRLLLFQFSQGHLPLERIKKRLNGDYERLWPILKGKFEQDKDGNFFNERLDEEFNKRRNYSESRRKNLKKHFTQTSKDDGKLSPHMGPHMENENEIENIIEILNRTVNTNYRANSEKNKKHIQARLNEGFKIQDFREVIDFKFKQWGTDEKMKEFLRPETLFGTKFESYLQASRLKIAFVNQSETSEEEIKERLRQKLG
jgi:uncharacterized phage protein (TIGR02220 family)